MTHFVTQKVLFKHCDPAGIVFFPRYFEIVNDVVEDWFSGPLDTPWHTFHETRGCPTVEISTTFSAISRHGDVLRLALDVIRLGRTSAELQITGSCDGELRFSARQTLVSVGSDHRPTPWEDVLRARMEKDLLT